MRNADRASVTGVAEVAMQSARHAARTIVRRVNADTCQGCFYEVNCDLVDAFEDVAGAVAFEGA
jgi:hypothetical protein